MYDILIFAKNISKILIVLNIIKNGLEAITSRYNQDTHSFKGYKFYLSTIESQILKAGHDNLKCFYLKSTSNINNIKLIVEQYFFVSNDSVYILTIGANDSTYLRSTEAKQLLESFRIYEYYQIDAMTVISIVGIICAILFIIVFILSKRKKNTNGIDNYKKINKDKKQEFNSLDFDEYNVGYSGNIENINDINLNKSNNFTTNTREKEANSKKEYLLPMRWYNFYGFIKLPIEIAILISSFCMYCNILFDYNFFVGILIMLISIIQLIYMIYLINVMSSKKKNGLNYITGWLCIETLMISLYTTLNTNNFNMLVFLISICLYTLIWFLPNYTYFKKREYIFEMEDK